MKYLVTGGAGFIGSHLIEDLINKGHQIICVDDLSSGHLSNLPLNQKIELIIKPIQKVEMKELPSHIDGIFHLAAQASVPQSIEDFLNSSKNNLYSMLKTWDIANEFNVPVVYATSSAVYGNLPVGDDTVEKYDILSPYAQDKLTMEHYANMAWKVYKTKSIGLRFFNVFGPRQDPSNPYSGVISIFIDRLKSNLPVTVNGGYQTRDFVYVLDVVRCITKSMTILQEKALCETLNVGTGKSVTIDSLLKNLSAIINVHPEVIKAKLPIGDPETSSGTYNKLKELLEININEFTSLEDGLKETVDFPENSPKKS